MSGILDHPEITKLLESVTVERAQEFKKRFNWKIQEKNGGYVLVHKSQKKLWLKPEGYYLANLVLQGGGTLGLAHVGMIAALERAGVRFVGIAATSAGAIVASGMFGIRHEDILHPTAPALSEHVATAPLHTFIDGPRPVRQFIKRALQKRSFASPTTWPSIWKSFQSILKKRGLNPGHAFETWLDQIMASHELETIAELTDRMNAICHKLKKAESDIKPSPFENLKPKRIFNLVTAGLPTGFKFNFPEDLEYLHPSYEQSSPAIMARCSMSVPLFFEPYRLKTNAKTWPEFVQKHRGELENSPTLKSYMDDDYVTFIDGGTFSNLPADRFFDDINEIPTIAVTLVGETPRPKYRRKASIASLVSDFIHLANMVRLVRDRDAIDDIKKQPKSKGGYNPLILSQVNTGDENFLNFNLTEASQRELVIRGIEAAKQLIK